jgi:phage-related protein
MPRTVVVFYQERPGETPVLDWPRELRGKNATAYQKCVAGLERLALLGRELRRPLADLLRDGIYELRIRKGHVNYRILYFFHGQGLAVLGHAITKEDVVPEAEIDRCIRRKVAFEAAPQKHSYVKGEGE